MDGQLRWRGKEFRGGISPPLFLLSSVFLARSRGAFPTRGLEEIAARGREFGYTVFYEITRHNRGRGSSPKKVLVEVRESGAGERGDIGRAEDARRRELINPCTSAPDNTNSSELSYFSLIHSVSASRQLNKSRRTSGT